MQEKEWDNAVKAAPQESWDEILGSTATFEQWIGAKRDITDQTVLRVLCMIAATWRAIKNKFEKYAHRKMCP